jgi:spore coat protein U-like protein
MAALRGMRQGVATIALLLCWSSAALADGFCTVSSNGIPFGTYDPLNPTDTTVMGTVFATCQHTTGGASNFVLTTTLSPGNSGSYPNRWMLRSGGTEQLFYNIFVDAGFTQVRGNGTGGTYTGPTTPIRVSNGKSEVVSVGTLYARIPAGQVVTPGSYSDTVVVTINY